jgi:hypothetical protein
MTYADGADGAGELTAKLLKLGLRMPNSDKPVSVGTMCFPWVIRKTLSLQPTDDLGSRRRRANALGFLQTFPQNLIVDEAPGVLHRLDQTAFVVTRGRSGLGSRRDRSLSASLGESQCPLED